MRMRVFVTIVICYMAYGDVSARILNVPGEYDTIQSAIIAAGTGDTVLVSHGTYDENLNLCGRNIVLASRFIYSGEEYDIANTIIDGGGRDRILLINSGEGGAIIEGFTMQNGNSGYSGGGIHIAGSTPTVRNNIIINNTSYGNGGGIALLNGANPTITHNLIAYNRSTHYNGGGISGENSFAIIKNNLIIGNRAYK